METARFQSFLLKLFVLSQEIFENCLVSPHLFEILRGLLESSWQTDVKNWFSAARYSNGLMNMCKIFKTTGINDIMIDDIWYILIS